MVNIIVLTYLEPVAVTIGHHYLWWLDVLMKLSENDILLGNWVNNNKKRVFIISYWFLLLTKRKYVVIVTFDFIQKLKSF